MPKNWEEFENIIKSMNTEEDFEKLQAGSDFSAKLIKARLKKNLTQSDLAFRAGLKQSAIARIENQGSLPRLDTVYKIAKALESTIDFYPINTEDASRDLVNEIAEQVSKLEVTINKLTNHVMALTNVIYKQNGAKIILNIVPQQNNISNRVEEINKSSYMLDTMDYSVKLLDIVKKGVVKSEPEWNFN